MSELETTECRTCGAAVLNTRQHAQWHAQAEATMKDTAKKTIDDWLAREASKPRGRRRT